MIGAIEAITQSVTTHQPRTPESAPAIEQTLQRPSEQMTAEFARAVTSSDQLATSSSPAVSAQEVAAAPPAAADDLGARLSQQADTLINQLQSLDPRSEPQAEVETAREAKIAVSQDGKASGGGSAMSSGKKKVDDVVSQMERAYTFAIEATLASRGSTEASRIFNTLLRGQ